MRYLALIALALIVSSAPTGEFNKKLTPGDAAPAWADLPGTDGKKHALVDFKDKPVLVVAFTCNSCPVAINYEDRMIAFARKHADRVGMVAINVNLLPEDSLAKMEERAKEKGLPYPYLFDESQKTARDYGALYTPEFFVLDKDRKVVYMGAMDDKAPPGAAKTNYIDDAVTALLKGEKPPKLETLAAAGCRIKFDRKKQ